MLTRTKRAGGGNRRLVCAAVLAGFTAASLSACSSPDPILARIKDREIVFLICEPVAASQILINVAKRDTVDYETTWVISGQTAIEKGDELRYGKPWTSWSEDFPPAPISVRKSAISIVIGDEPLPEKAELSATFAGWELSMSHWIDSRGNAFDGCP
jgi:hypothetical protein